MAVTYGYFNSIGGDRRYNAEHMSRYFSGIVSRGILANLRGQFAVTATGTDMSVQVAPGRAFFSDGKWVESDAVESLAISPSDVLLNRIDLVVLRKDRNDIARNVIITIKKGTPAIDPTAPALENTEYVEELCLAQVRINALAEAITGSNITDTRLDKTVCGFVTGVIQQVDTTTLYQQYQAAGQEDRAVNQAAFDTWFNAMKGQLTEDAAGNLQTQIDNHKADFTNPHQVTKEQIGAAGLEYVETQLSNKANKDDLVQQMVTLWSGGIAQGTMTLKDYVSNYDQIIIVTRLTANPYQYHISNTYMPVTFNLSSNQAIIGEASPDVLAAGIINFGDNQIRTNGKLPFEIGRIYGIKYPYQER